MLASTPLLCYHGAPSGSTLSMDWIWPGTLPAGCSLSPRTVQVYMPCPPFSFMGFQSAIGSPGLLNLFGCGNHLVPSFTGGVCLSAGSLGAGRWPRPCAPGLVWPLALSCGQRSHTPLSINRLPRTPARGSGRGGADVTLEGPLASADPRGEAAPSTPVHLETPLASDLPRGSPGRRCI